MHLYLVGEKHAFQLGFLNHLSRHFELKAYTAHIEHQPHDVFVCLEASAISLVPDGSPVLLILPHFRDEPIDHTSLPSTVSVLLIGADPTESEYQLATRSLFGFKHLKEVVIGTPRILPLPEVSRHVAAPVVPVTKQQRRKTKRIPLKPFIYAVLVLLVSLSIPFVSLGVSVGSLYLSLKALPDHTTLSTRLTSLSTSAASVSRLTMTPLTVLPVLKPQITYFLSLSALSSSAAQVTRTGVVLLTQIETLAHNYFAGNPIDWKDTGARVAPLLSSLYHDGSFLLANGGEVLSASIINQKADLPYLLSFLPAAEGLAKEAGTLAGQGKPFTYMIMFQNAAELRPTGGFFGSYQLVTVQSGRVISKEIQDVYDADGKINGYVKPPFAISEYLKEASWHMRDANWDIDFPSTATRISWFLQKAIDVKPDAIIAVNTRVLAEVLTVTGPVHPVGWEEDEVTSENLYKMLERRGGDTFFPGSIRKKTYLSALSESVMIALSNLSRPQMLELAKKLDQQIRAREIMVWFADSGLESAIDTAQLSGSFREGSCGEGCNSIVHQIIEANVGVNKVNPYISRTITETVAKEGDSVTGDVVLSLTHAGGYENKGNESYKSYIRLLLPKEASVTSIKVNSRQKVGSVIPDLSHEEKYLSAGALLTVEAGETAEIRFHWSIKSPQNRAQIYWIKQPGVAPFTLSLTAAGVGVYNTSLTDSKIFNLQK